MPANPKRIQTAITLLRANGYRVIQAGAPAHRPRIEGCDAACSEAKHTRACLARKYRRNHKYYITVGRRTGLVVGWTCHGINDPSVYEYIPISRKQFDRLMGDEHADELAEVWADEWHAKQRSA